jgi:hypothetical protein
LQTPANLFASIWMQLAIQFQSTPSQALIDLYHESIEKGTRPSMNEVLGILRNEVEKHFKVFVVIDALDECEEAASRILLRELSHGLQNLCLMVTSRHSGPASADVTGFKNLELSCSDTDMALYIEGRIENVPLLLRLSEKDQNLKSKIKESILQKAEGM